MRIGLISDTHVPDHRRELPCQLKRLFDGTDLILHAGDIYTTWVLDELENMAPVLAAKGDDERSFGRVPTITAKEQSAASSRDDEETGAPKADGLDETAAEGEPALETEKNAASGLRYSLF